MIKRPIMSSLCYYCNEVDEDCSRIGDCDFHRRILRFVPSGVREPLSSSEVRMQRNAAL